MHAKQTYVAGRKYSDLRQDFPEHDLPGGVAELVQGELAGDRRRMCPRGHLDANLHVAWHLV